ncbi:MAG: hypothetical protein AB4426_24035 [Xenococcaceae cyanobacterium]
MEKLFETIKGWLADPMAGKLIEVGIGLLVITLIFRVLSRALSHYIQDSDVRYHLRKAITFARQNGKRWFTSI